jgi:uncharacterized protein YcfJ
MADRQPPRTTGQAVAEGIIDVSGDVLEFAYTNGLEAAKPLGRAIIRSSAQAPVYVYKFLSEEDKWRATAGIVGGFGGGLLLGGVGTMIAGPAGGLTGGIAGSNLGEALAEDMYDDWQERNERKRRATERAINARNAQQRRIGY